MSGNDLIGDPEGWRKEGSWEMGQGYAHSTVTMLHRRISQRTIHLLRGDHC